jgi:hypothetical protein
MRPGEYTKRYHGALIPLGGGGGQFRLDEILIKAGLPSTVELRTYKECLTVRGNILYPDENKPPIDINGYKLLESLQTYSIEIHHMEATCKMLIALRDENLEEVGMDVGMIDVAGRVLRTIREINAQGPYGDMLTR